MASPRAALVQAAALSGAVASAVALAQALPAQASQPLPMPAAASPAAGGSVEPPVSLSVTLQPCALPAAVAAAVARPASGQGAWRTAVVRVGPAVAGSAPPSPDGSAPRRELQIAAEGLAQVAGPLRWTAAQLAAAGPAGVCVPLAMRAAGEGRLVARVVESDASGRVLWAPSQILFLLATPQGQWLSGPGSGQALWREWLQQQLQQGRIDQQTFDRQQQRLLDGHRMEF